MAELPNSSDIQRLSARPAAAFTLACMRLIEAEIRKSHGNAIADESFMLMELIVCQPSLEKFKIDDPLRLSSATLQANSMLPDDKHGPGLALLSALMLTYHAYKAIAFPLIYSERSTILAAREAERAARRAVSCFDSSQEERISKSVVNIFNKVSKYIDTLDKSQIGDPIDLSVIREQV